MLGTCPEGSGVKEVREWGRKGGKRVGGVGRRQGGIVTEVNRRERGMVNNGEGILQKRECNIIILVSTITSACIAVFPFHIVESTAVSCKKWPR